MKTHVIPSGNGTKNKKGKIIMLWMSICKAIAIWESWIDLTIIFQLAWSSAANKINNNIESWLIVKLNKKMGMLPSPLISNI